MLAICFRFTCKVRPVEQYIAPLTPPPPILADACDLLARYGLSSSTSRADEKHPYGYGFERYVWSMISGVGSFFLGQWLGAVLGPV